MEKVPIMAVSSWKLLGKRTIRTYRSIDNRDIFDSSRWFFPFFLSRGVAMARSRSHMKDQEYDPIPLEWNERSSKTFDVPSGGTDKADFEIKGPPLKSRKK